MQSPHRNANFSTLYGICSASDGAIPVKSLGNGRQGGSLRVQGLQTSWWRISSRETDYRNFRGKGCQNGRPQLRLPGEFHKGKIASGG